MNKKKENEIESEYWEEVEVTDPVTKKKTLQKVKIIKLKSIEKTNETKSISEELGEEVSNLTWDITDDNSETDE